MDPDDCLDILGQQPFLNIYTQICLIFPVPGPSSDRAILDTLTAGLERLSTSLPWVSGQVIKGHSKTGSPAAFRIAPYNATPILLVKDLRGDGSIPTLHDLKRARFPFRMLDEDIFAPYKTLPGGVAGSGQAPTPVFAVQASFITGGLILAFVAQHQAMDLTGQCQVMSILSKMCRGEKLTNAQIFAANPTRRGRIPTLGDSYKPGPELEFQMAKPAATKPLTDEAPPLATWAYFAFSPQSLASIKLVAKEHVTVPPAYVSTDDALSAFVWKSVGRVRVQRIGVTARSTLGRAVDVRRYLGVPQTYPGLLQNMVYHTHTLEELVSRHLGSIASELRLAVEPGTSKLARNTQALATMIDRARDKSVLSLTARINPNTDLMISSWTNPTFYNMDFGLGLGKPEAVRRPRFVPVEGLAYFMPRALGEEIVLAICLKGEDMCRLRLDVEFLRHASYIG